MAESKRELAARADVAATELQALAHDITAVIETLPKSASAATKELLEQQARRALAIAAALRVEAASPDRLMVDLLMQARGVLAVLVVAALSTVTVGALEQAGADAWDAARAGARHLAGDEDLEDVADLHPDAALSYREMLRDFREERGLTRAQLSKYLHVSAEKLKEWENGVGPLPSNFFELLDRLKQLDSEDIEALRSPK